MTTDLDYESPATRAQLAKMRASLERAEMARTVWGQVFKDLESRNLTADYAFIDRLQQSIKETVGVSHEDEQLLAQADELRRTRAVVKAEMAAQASMSSTMPEGYGENVGTDAAPVFISLPVELNVANPTPVVHNHLPEPAATRRSDLPWHR